MESIRERVLKVVAEESGYDATDLKGIDNLQADLGLDSLGMIKLQMALEEEFGVEMSDKSFRNVHTVGGLIAFVAIEV